MKHFFELHPCGRQLSGKFVWGGLCLITALAAGLRIYCFFNRPYPLRDELFYVRFIETWRDHGVVAAYGDGLLTLPPLFPALVQWMSRLTGLEVIVAGAICNIISGCLLVLLVFMIGRELQSTGVGLLAALLAAIHPGLVEFSSIILRESVALMLLAAFLLCFLAAIRHNHTLLKLFAGILLCMVVATRIEHIEFLLYIIAIRGVYCCWQRVRVCDFIKECGCLLGGMLIFMVLFSCLTGESPDFWIRTVGDRLFHHLRVM